MQPKGAQSGAFVCLPPSPSKCLSESASNTETKAKPVMLVTNRTNEVTGSRSEEGGGNSPEQQRVWGRKEKMYASRLEQVDDGSGCDE